MAEAPARETTDTPPPLRLVRVPAAVRAAIPLVVLACGALALAAAAACWRDMLEHHAGAPLAWPYGCPNTFAVVGPIVGTDATGRPVTLNPISVSYKPGSAPMVLSSSALRPVLCSRLRDAIALGVWGAAALLAALVLGREGPRKRLAAAFLRATRRIAGPEPPRDPRTGRAALRYVLRMVARVLLVFGAPGVLLVGAAAAGYGRGPPLVYLVLPGGLLVITALFAGLGAILMTSALLVLPLAPPAGAPPPRSAGPP